MTLLQVPQQRAGYVTSMVKQLNPQNIRFHNKLFLPTGFNCIKRLEILYCTALNKVIRFVLYIEHRWTFLFSFLPRIFFFSTNMGKFKPALGQ